MTKFTIIAILLPFLSIGQVIPLNDNNWVLNESLSDEFDSLNHLKWNTLDALMDDPYCCNLGGFSFFEDDNAQVIDNELVLTADGPNVLGQTLYYWNVGRTGGIQTLERNYSYGYYEISAKLPGNYHNGTANGQKFWPCFWTFYETFDSLGVFIDKGEIDILEPSGVQYADARTNVVGWHRLDTAGVGYKVGEDSMQSNLPLFSGYNKFAVEWLPDRLIYYFNDQSFFEVYNDSTLEMDSMFVVIDLQIDSTSVPYANFNSSITFPQTMNVDYFRYYELNKDFCTEDLVIQSTFSFYNHAPGIRGNVAIIPEIGVYMSSNTSKVIRASNEIYIEKNFSVPIGATLDLIPTICN